MQISRLLQHAKRTRKQSPNSQYTTYVYTQKKPRSQKLHGAIGVGGGRPLRLPLDPPLHNTIFTNAHNKQKLWRISILVTPLLHIWRPVAVLPESLFMFEAKDLTIKAKGKATLNVGSTRCCNEWIQDRLHALNCCTSDKRRLTASCQNILVLWRPRNSLVATAEDRFHRNSLAKITDPDPDSSPPPRRPRSTDSQRSRVPYFHFLPPPRRIRFTGRFSASPV